MFRGEKKSLLWSLWKYHKVNVYRSLIQIYIFHNMSLVLLWLINSIQLVNFRFLNTAKSESNTCVTSVQEVLHCHIGFVHSMKSVIPQWFTVKVGKKTENVGNYWLIGKHSGKKAKKKVWKKWLQIAKNDCCEGFHVRSKCTEVCCWHLYLWGWEWMYIYSLS